MILRPDFMIIGAMKCATSTMHYQLAHQPGIYMSDPKEPNFFSDDEIYAQGLDWYEGLFAPAERGSICGESSTHYTKRPTYPRTIERLMKHAPHAKFIYVMRHPIDRLVSHYIHECTQGVIDVPIDRAIEEQPELIHYGLYGMQLKPYLEAYRFDQVLPVFLGRLRDRPLDEMTRIARFIGYDGTVKWNDELRRKNVSNERLRKCEWRDTIVRNPILGTLRRAVIPKTIRNWVKRIWAINHRPVLTHEIWKRLSGTFNEDLHVLGSWLGVDLNCENFDSLTASSTLDWTAPNMSGANDLVKGCLGPETGVLNRADHA